MNLLFICTHNRCRSILAEAITDHIAQGRLHAHSAGSQPASEVHPDTLKALQRHQYPTAGLRSQSWDQFSELNPRVVITLCDEAANEVCPVWLDQGIKVHWGLPDPSRVSGTAADRQAAFDQLIGTLEARIQHLLSNDLDRLDDASLRAVFESVSRGGAKA